MILQKSTKIFEPNTSKNHQATHDAYLKNMQQKKNKLQLNNQEGKSFYKKAQTNDDKNSLKVFSNLSRQNFLSVTQFLQLLDDKEWNRFKVILKSYNIQDWQSVFRTEILKLFCDQFVKQGIVIIVRINNICFSKDQQFKIYRSESLHQELRKNIKNEIQELSDQDCLNHIIEKRKQSRENFLHQFNSRIIQHIQLAQQRQSLQANIQKQKKREKVKLQIKLINYYLRLEKEVQSKINQLNQNQPQMNFSERKKQYPYTLFKKRMKQNSNHQNKPLQTGHIHQQKPTLNGVNELDVRWLLEEAQHFEIAETLVQKFKENKQKYIKYTKCLQEWLHEVGPITDIILSHLKSKNKELTERNLFFELQDDQITFLYTQNQLKFIAQSALQQLKQVAESYKKQNKSVLIEADTPSYSLLKDSFFKNFLEEQNETTFILQKILTYLQLAFWRNEKRKQTNKQKEIRQKQQLESLINIKEAFRTIIVFNYIMVCNKFYRKRSLNLQYYCKIEQISLNQSKKAKKIEFFWKTFQNNNLIKKIYSQCTLSFEELNMIRKSQPLNLQKIYNYYLQKDQINLKLKYKVHLIQFYIQIVTCLTGSDYISFLYIHNGTRFLLIYFITFFLIQMIKKIESEIIEKFGELYFNAYKQEIKTTHKLLQVIENVKKSVVVSFSKIEKYRSYFKDKQKIGNNQDPRKSNAQKIDKIFSKYPEIKKTYRQLSKIHVDQVFEINYDFQMTKKIYLSALTILADEYSNMPIIQRDVKKKIFSVDKQDMDKFQNLNLSNNFFNGYKQFLKSNKFNLDSLLKPQDQLKNTEQFQFMYVKFCMYLVEKLKITSMILALPFFSYQSELQLLRNKEQNKVFEKSNGNLLCTLDQFYIHQKKKVCNEHLINLASNATLPGMFQKYLQKSVSLFELYNQKQPKNQMKKITDFSPQRLEIALPKSHKLLHEDRMSVFTKFQCKHFFFILFPHFMLPAILFEKSLVEKFRDFFGFFKEFKKKSVQNLISFTRNLQNMKMGNRKEQKLQKEESGYLLDETLKEKSEINKLKQLTQKNTV